MVWRYVTAVTAPLGGLCVKRAHQPCGSRCTPPRPSTRRRASRCAAKSMLKGSCFMTHRMEARQIVSYNSLCGLHLRCHLVCHLLQHADGDICRRLGHQRGWVHRTAPLRMEDHLAAARIHGAIPPQCHQRVHLAVHVKRCAAATASRRAARAASGCRPGPTACNGSDA